MNSTIVLTLTDLEYHGRVQSLLMLSFSGFGLAALPLGIVADAVGLRMMLTIMGGICLVTMGLYIAVQSRHRRRGGSFDLRDSPA
jgi:fucose permease